jgi:hypothetical protein
MNEIARLGDEAVNVPPENDTCLHCGSHRAVFTYDRSAEHEA